MATIEHIFHDGHGNTASEVGVEQRGGDPFVILEFPEDRLCLSHKDFDVFIDWVFFVKDKLSTPEKGIV